LNHKISEVEVFLVSTPVKSGFSDSTRKIESVGMVVVRVVTDQGLIGIGVTYNEVGGESIRELIKRNLAPKLIGRDPFETEVIWEELFHYIRGVGRKGLAFCALSVLDIALWDLKGKILNIPLYKLLGGNKKRIPIYASGGWTSYSEDELVAEALEMVARGYKMIKLKVGVKGGQCPNEDVARIKRIRQEIGDDIGLMVDANNVWKAATAIQVANKLRDCDIYLFEEPVMADDIGGLARFKAGTDIPLGTGEHEYTKYGIRDLVMANAVDVVQLDVARCGGFTEMLKIIAITQAWNLSFAPHAFEHMHMHLVSAASNGLFLERLFLFEELTELVFLNPPTPKDGYLEISDLPGLGLELNIQAIMDLKEK
jgi:L-rhamnonate dehydratase